MARGSLVGALLLIIGLACGGQSWGEPSPSGATPLPRVASATVCGDQYVLALADPAQIAALSSQATDPRLSLLAEDAAAYPRRPNAAEAYLDAGVDVLITNAWTDHTTARLLERFGVRVVRIPTLNDMDAIAAMTRDIGHALGQPERGDALAARFVARVDALRQAAPGRDRLALYLRPGGGTAADGAYVATLMEAAGLRNQATEAGLTGWTSWNLERFIAAPPEVIITSFFNSPGAARARVFSNHPAFVRRAARIDRIDVPGRNWVCGGWVLAEAAAVLQSRLEHLNAADLQP
ncbi:ABC transporter substrate-binding protein [Roseospira marina]|uniref:ABC transporter substrate-binding protein n=1 Tax=Roseospira marina TaxID=140057 RepID=A0A5M6I878_9PROT|nr:ABC transporter substrate-binding protein [Roseospira marina]KAA5604460.1 ABC transporter substrate-binding protein [Roseospira marina]MBB4315505.1 iron complex transport system substrate-binding protein [Roseospira marina]MBB5088558.1 iron complex transport system substrate-binding protein [Roseospira marina]